MRQRRPLNFGLAIASALILVSTIAAPAHADSTGADGLALPPLTMTNSQDVPAEYLVYPDGTPLPPGTPTMTNEEMEAFGTTETGQPSKAKKNKSQSVTPAAVVGGCTLDIGAMWYRSSSKAEPHGGVGAKPAVKDCWGQVTKTYMQSYVWMHNGFIWFSAAGPSEAWGTGNMVDKKLVYVCKGTGTYPFRVQTYMRVEGPQGVLTGHTSGKSAEYKFKCG